MKSKKLKRALAVILILSFWVAVFFTLQSLLVPKYQSGVVEGSMIEEYYDETTDHEVIMVGDCEVYENISTVELWREYGITSYIRGSAQQLAWHSYYLLEDTLRYEKPRVVVFNVLSLKYNEPQSEAYNRMTLDGMRWSATKVNAIKASMTEDEDFADYVFPLLRYHSRWSSLTDDDFRHIFSKEPVTHSGYYMRADVLAQGEFPSPLPLTDYQLGDYAMKYLDMMTELCKDNSIELVLIKAPTEYPHWYDEWDRQISEYAEEQGIEYINFIPLSDEIGLDMTQDTYDAGLHLNVYGAEKLADYFGEWLISNYELTDYRNNADYKAVWDKKVAAYDNEKQCQLDEIAEHGKLISFYPVEEKETHVLRNFLILLLVAVICIALVACGGKEVSNDSSAESGASQLSEEVYAFSYKGVQVKVDDVMSDLLTSLGEPTKYFESQSCAFQGLDKVYTYPNVIIRTYPKDGVDYVLNVEFRDDTVSTAEGVCIGDTKSKVESVYGEPTQKTDVSYSYTKGGSILSFIFEGDTVTSVTYTSPVA